MLFKTVASCLLLIITVRAECPCSKCTQCLTGLLVKSPTQDMRMDCYAIEPLDSKNASKLAKTAIPIISQGNPLGNFIRGLRGGIKGVAEGAGIPTPNAQERKDGGDIPAIEPPELNEANSIDASDLSIAQGCAGTVFYVSKQPITKNISDRKCWKKLELRACPPGKELMLLKGTLHCFNRTVLKDEGTRNLECFE